LELAVKNDKAEEATVVQGVTLETNDPQQPRVALRLLGHMRREVWVDRPVVSFRDLQPQEMRTVPVRIFSSWPEGFTLSQVTARPSELQVETSPLDPADLSAAEADSGLLLHVTCPLEVNDLLWSKITVRMKRNNSDQEEEYHLDVRGNRLGLLGVFGEPLDELGRIKLGNLQQGIEKTVSYSLKARGTNKVLRALQVRVTPAFLDVGIKPAEQAAANGLHQLVVTVPGDVPEGSYQGSQAGQIEIDFADEYPSLVFKVEFAVVNDAHQLSSNVRGLSR
jgi:hypothetical protein